MGRVDLKADRANGRLQVLGAFLEPETSRRRQIQAALRQALNDMAVWLNLDRVEIAKHGDLF